MKSLRNLSLRIAVAALVSTTVAACGGGQTSMVRTIPVPSSSPAAAASYTGPFADATFTVTIPAEARPAARGRRPDYVSAATKSVLLELNSASDLTAAEVNAYNTGQLGKFNVGTLPNATCPLNGSAYTCSFTVKLPPGTDSVTVTAYSAANDGGSLLSGQTKSFTLTAGMTNNLSIVLDANVKSLALAGTGSCASGTVGATYGSVGTAGVTFDAAYADQGSDAVVGPGLPLLSLLGNDSKYHSDQGTITGTGGSVSFTINQAAQTFTLTPSNASVTGASVSVRATPPTASDGLSFSLTQQFTFSTGPAAPRSFLAAIEQMGTGSGAVDLYTVTLGGSGGPDAFTAFTPARLAVTNSTNEGKPDVDNPLDAVFDTGGDLLIGNGGTTTGSPADDGSLACVPAGSIVTGADNATTTSTNVDDPAGIAYDSRDGSVALADDPVSAPYQLSEYVLSGNYTAATAPRNLVASGYGDLATVGIPALGAGTYAAALTDGLETDPAHTGNNPVGKSKIAILAPNGGETDITDSSTFAIDVPHALAWDSTNDQLVIANDSTWHRDLSFYTVAPVVKTKVIDTGNRNYAVAAAPNGFVAVAWTTEFGYPQIQVYDNTSARNTVLGPIPYNGTMTSCGSDYIYGDGVTVNSLQWLSNTKLLVALQSYTSGAATSLNGLHIYDISTSAVPSGYDDNSCNPFAAAPKQTAFVHITNKPLGAAYKP